MAESPRHAKSRLSRKMTKFVDAYVANGGNGSAAVREAGYSQSSSSVVRQMATENLTKPSVIAAIAAKEALIITPERVQGRLAALSEHAESEGQFGPAVRAEELLGKSIGMWIDQHLSVVVGSEHVTALLEAARKRQQEPIDLRDDEYVELEQSKRDREDGYEPG